MRFLTILLVCLFGSSRIHGQDTSPPMGKTIPDSLMQGEMTDAKFVKLRGYLRQVQSEERYAAGKRMLSYALRTDLPPTQIAFCYRILASAVNHTDLDSALHFNHQASLLYDEKEADDVVWPLLAYERAEYYNGTGRYDSMLYYIDKTMAFESVKDHVPIMSAAMQLKSSLYESRAQYDTAQIILLDALDILAEGPSNDKTVNRVRAAIYVKLGKLYRKSGNFSKHRRTLIESLATVNDSTTRVVILSNLCGSYQESAQYDSAYVYANLARSFMHDIETSNIVYKRLAETTTALGRFREAARMRDSLLKYNALASDYYVKPLSPVREGALLVGLGRVAEGDAIFRSVFRPDSAYVDNWKAAGYLDYLKAMAPHRPQKTLAYQFDTLKQLVFAGLQSNNSKLIEDLRVRYETEKVEAANEVLLLQNEAATTAATNRKRQLWLVLALLAAVLGGFYVAVRNSRRRRLLNEELARKNDRITLLNTDINHRTNGYLGNIVKLLDEQKYKLEDANADPRVLDELGRQTYVYSKLQNLLTITEDDRTVVNLSNYVRELTDLLTASFRGSGMPLLLTLDVADIDVDPKIAAPLALILNELMTNTAKYAARSNGAIAARFRASKLDDETLLVEYADDGPGTAIDTSAYYSSNTGLDLIDGLSRQLEATVEETEGFGYRARIKL